MTLVEKIQELCSAKNTTLVGLEREINLGRGTIRNWDTSSPSIDKVQKVANYFKVSIDYLLDHGDIYDIGSAIREERENQGISQKELADQMGISEYELSQYEDDIVPLTEELANKFSNIFGMSFPALLVKYGLSDIEIPSHFDGNVDAYLAFKRAVDEDVINEDRYGLSPKEERDIAIDLERMMSNLEGDQALAFYGEPLDEESKELLRISLENSMRIAKQAAKKKFTPKKYK